MGGNFEETLFLEYKLTLESFNLSLGLDKTSSDIVVLPSQGVVEYHLITVVERWIYVDLQLFEDFEKKLPKVFHLSLK